MRDDALQQGACRFFVNAPSPEGEPIMTRNLRGSLLIASMLIVAWATTSEACHRRRACPPAPCGYTGYTYAGPTGYYGAGGGYATAGGGYYGGGYAGGTAGYPGGGYDFGRPGYNPGGLGGPASGLGVQPGLGFGAPGMDPGGLGGPASGLGVRPGLGVGGLGRGADRPQVLRSPCGGAPAGHGLMGGGVGGGQLMVPRPVTARLAAGEELRHGRLVRPGVTPVATRPFGRPSGQN